MSYAAACAVIGALIRWRRALYIQHRELLGALLHSQHMGERAALLLNGLPARCTRRAGTRTRPTQLLPSQLQCHWASSTALLTLPLQLTALTLQHYALQPCGTS